MKRRTLVPGCVVSRTSAFSILVALIVSCFLPASRALAEGPPRDPCPTWYADCDGDTFFKVSGIVSCVEPTTGCLDGQAPDGGWTNDLPGSPDCDDEDPSEYPGQDWYADCDGDGSFSSVAVIACDEAGADALTPCIDTSPPDGGWSHTAGSDCDDADSNEYPGQDWYADCDGDGSFSSAAVIACDFAGADALTPCSDASPPDGGWSHTAGSDCDDADSNEYPGQDWYADCDGDGSFSSSAVIACDLAGADALTPCGDASPPDGGWNHTAGSDCDDADSNEYPGQDWYADCDGDGSFSSTAVIACDLAGADALTPCIDTSPPDGGWSHTAGSDCDDADSNEYPGQDWYADCDGDGSFSSSAVIACDLAGADTVTPCGDAAPPDGGWSHTAGSDCDDADSNEYPGQDWYADCDGDGSFSSVAVVACDAFEADASTPCYDSYPPDGGWGNSAGSDCDDEDASRQVIDSCGICGGDGTNCEIFADGFESGGTTRWSVRVP